MLISWLLLYSICSTVVVISQSQLRHRETEEHQVRLIRDLLDSPKYDKRAIPIKGPQHPINVTMRMTLYQLIEVVSAYHC